jgi:hypothetical protein
LANTFNKISLQHSLEWAYEQAAEVLRLTGGGSQRLPHIIGSSGEFTTRGRSGGGGGSVDMVDHAVGMLRKLMNIAGRNVQVAMEVDSDSDDPAVDDLEGSIRAIRNRLLSALSDKELSALGICRLVHSNEKSAVICEAGWATDDEEQKCETLKVRDI